MSRQLQSCLLWWIAVGLVYSYGKFPISFSCEGVDLYNGKHIVFSGDSLMHFQYLSFVYTLRHCVEISVKQVPTISEHNWESWSRMFVGTNGLLSPFETCDCFRNDAGFVSGQVYTNRYYYDSYRNVTVTYMNFGWNGKFCQGREHEKTILSATKIGLWKYSLPEAVTTHLTRLRSKPDILLLNAGFWKNEFHIESYREEVLNAVKTVPGLQLIWKTTNYGEMDNSSRTLDNRKFLHADANFFEVDTAMCGYAGVGCLNLSWTKNLPPKSWVVDGYHFRSFVYNWMNRQLRELIAGNVVDVYEQYQNASFANSSVTRRLQFI